MTAPKVTPSPSELKKRRRQAIIGSVLFGVLTVLFVGALVNSYVRDEPLRGGDLVNAEAVVTDFDAGRRSRSDEISVTYDVPGGSRWHVDIPVSRRFDTGETVEVEYAPDDPGLVRTVDDWAPSYTSPWRWLVTAVPSIALVVCVVGIAKPATMPASRADNRTWKMGPLGLNWGVWGVVGVVVFLAVVIALYLWVKSAT